MEVFNPQTAEHFLQRNKLLQNAMRPDDLPFDIASEYPIVLAEQNAQFSYCQSHENKIVVHANLWPRVWSDTNKKITCKVGLVGNVATDESMRGRGLMSSLFVELEKIANSQNLEALILWSDLLSFYQKLGYNAHSREIRLFFDRSKLAKLKATKQFLPTEADSITSKQCSNLLKSRCLAHATLERTPEEFLKLLQIPYTDLFLNKSGAYGIAGKGCDMGGVLHEWAAATKEEVLQLVADAADAYDLDELILLAPNCLPKGWLTFLADYCSNVEDHPMALMKSMGGPNIDNSAVLDSIASGFIWGLDSI